MNEQELTELIADLVFAYVNCDLDFPHDFEINTIIKACDYLLEEYNSGYYETKFYEI